MLCRRSKSGSLGNFHVAMWSPEHIAARSVGSAMSGKNGGLGYLFYLVAISYLHMAGGVLVVCARAKWRHMASSRLPGEHPKVGAGAKWSSFGQAIAKGSGPLDHLLSHPLGRGFRESENLEISSILPCTDALCFNAE